MEKHTSHSQIRLERHREEESTTIEHGISRAAAIAHSAHLNISLWQSENLIVTLIRKFIIQIFAVLSRRIHSRQAGRGSAATNLRLPRALDSDWSISFRSNPIVPSQTCWLIPEADGTADANERITLSGIGRKGA
ncbi:hypothetical protein PSACC_01780 [Paramicrosporidium saccamoebae]|uniref:Uncharacterized protein n=1 Tax=Paramicrosporidium saccamoebae TaxID=1246581 RepID=A0A2H9TKV7_9FUNG|nr:hypothetical protein PSACC_01780 [Paramicrosporidium saccamoebae]